MIEAYKVKVRPAVKREGIPRWSLFGLAFGLAWATACSNNEVTRPSEPVCVVSVSALAFGDVDVGQTKDLTLRVENAGGGALWVVPSTCANDSVGCEPCPNFSIVGDADIILLDGGAATFTVRFAPTSPGEHTCLLDISVECPPVPLSGTGLAAQ